jgi:uncharacterized protein
MQDKLAQLRQILNDNAPLVIAYSGGVDSAYLLAAAHATLGDRMLGVIADSPSLPRAALKEALEVAAQIGAPVEVVKTEELANPDYVANPPGRCYFCKAELFTKLDQLAISRGFKAIAYGENADDMAHERPGRRAAEQFKIIAPLRDAGMTKAEIRDASRSLNLPTADAPAQPCLSSRIPWGTAVTPDALAMVEAAEEAVRGLGFKVFRVRHLASPGGLVRAKLLVAPNEMDHLQASRPELESGIRTAGYAEVEFDPEGYRGPGI